MGSWKDRLGILASVVCAIHCAATPILIACLPTLKLTEWMAGPAFHQWAALICTGLVAIAIVPTFLKSWDYRVLGLSVTGIGLIISAAFFMPDDCCTQSLAALGTPASRRDAADADPANASHRLDLLKHADHHHDHDGHGHHDHEGHGHHDHDQAEDGRDSDAAVLAGVGIQPWLTPLGGMLLIFAHALNLYHRRRDASACCPADSRHAGYSPDRLRTCDAEIDAGREYAQAS